MPPPTIDAFRDHGVVERTVDAERRRSAAATIEALEQNGISMHDVTDKLLVDGLASFQKSFDTLLAGSAEEDESAREGAGRESDCKRHSPLARIHQPPNSRCATAERRSSARWGPPARRARRVAQPHRRGPQRRPHQLLARHARAARRDDRAGPRRRRTRWAVRSPSSATCRVRASASAICRSRACSTTAATSCSCRSTSEQGDEIPVTYESSPTTSTSATAFSSTTD